MKLCGDCEHFSALLPYVDIGHCAKVVDIAGDPFVYSFSDCCCRKKDGYSVDAPITNKKGAEKTKIGDVRDL